MYECGNNSPLNTEGVAVEETVAGVGGVQSENGIGSYDTAVGQPEDNVLREVPCGMYAHADPDTVEIPDAVP